MDLVCLLFDFFLFDDEVVLRAHLPESGPETSSITDVTKKVWDVFATAEKEFGF